MKITLTGQPKRAGTVDLGFERFVQVARS